jgi:catabolite regulation protein CreA
MAVTLLVAGCSMKTITPGQLPTQPYEIGSVDTAFQWIGPDHKIEIGAVPDPKVE